MELLSPEGLRQDGRRPRELRNLQSAVDTLGNADGSATFELGNTKVMAAVFGPRAAQGKSSGGRRDADIRCEFAIAAFSQSERKQLSKRDRRILEVRSMLKEALKANVLAELMPGTTIDVYVQVLAADGSIGAASLNAAFLAVADAGIPVKDLMAACVVGLVQDTPILDLNQMEEQMSRGPSLMMAMHVGLKKIVVFQADGRMPVEGVETLAELAEGGCQAVGKAMRSVLLDNTRKLALARGPVRL
ncbi:hypothetical protein WJX73_009242 [Symbiochloris irregularis]|uniref:Uncharacterized protein n=1 Tax=Symbiochloris irregularis TaxID=706552 RepID=A0AAW1PNZ9_9CHLO